MVSYRVAIAATGCIYLCILADRAMVVVVTIVLQMSGSDMFRSQL